MPVTIRDVARAAGVSITTVSRALNGHKDVGEKTRQRILRIAEELNYRPSAVARSLVTQKTRTIGFLVSDLSKGRIWHYFMLQILYGIQDRLAELGYDLILVNTTTTRQREISYLDFCTERRLDGVIVINLRLDDPYLHEVVESPLPSVVIDIPLVSATCGYVTSDNVYGAKLAVRHLIGKGHRTIGFVNGHSQAAVSHDRLRGYREALESHGIPFRPELVYEADYTVEGGRKGCELLRTAHPEMTAVFFASDLMAIGGLHHLREAGVKVPEECAVVGFDDIELAEIVSPQLTTIRQKRYEMGATAAEMLVGMMEGKTMPEGRTLLPELVVRQTS
ncbi:LacI family transcriptional regulator [Alicyclobacillus cellulosilyticus]|uniref:LacI family transcriptional regulator n=1 Tax=Alicyclobacillus cellulosilyticus TaxID=1003997 RepID=A0A917NHP4_9BACL|nr:LacI family DNA-binding transcriptional regulator [Alicyclobacillus cellulosilyticus]GGI98909.1 LacI family transcriptional regulator [Alicyclobacillus cellulosilyticus]